MNAQKIEDERAQSKIMKTFMINEVDEIIESFIPQQNFLSESDLA